MRVSARRVLTGLLILGGISTLTQFLRFFLPCWQPSQGAGEPVTVLVRDGWRVSSDVPLVFVGGVPRSGTTLMRYDKRKEEESIYLLVYTNVLNLYYSDTQYGYILYVFTSVPCHFDLCLISHCV